ncbi:SMI1/KNR4 family protein, partial [Escherichia coli]|nr:SMI1/KNR4 family protein [Escherichia coli]
MVSKAETLWQRILAKGANERPDFREALGLQQGASEEEIRDVETGLGFY